MLALKEAIEIAERNVWEGHTLLDSYGETQGEYVFSTQDSRGIIPPGGFFLTVNKETGACRYEGLEREFLAPYAPIKGYKKLELLEEQ